MTTYEWCRVVLGVFQLVATLGVPFVMVWLDNRAIRRHIEKIGARKKKPAKKPVKKPKGRRR